MKKTLLLIIFFSFVSSIISLYPIINLGTKAALFNFEPDVPYVANAISYIYTGKITYSGHPATPSIIALSYSLLPLRIYSKFIDRVPFFIWTIRNQDFLYTYERYFVSAIFGLSVFVFLLSIYYLTKSIKSLIITWIGLFLYSNTPYLGIIIQSEPFSFLILSFWFLFFVNFIKHRNITNFLILCLLSGISVANKLPNMFFVFSSLSFALLIKSGNNRLKFKTIFFGAIISLLGFLVFTWPIHEQYPALWSWIVHLSTHSGVHGSGGNEIINFSSQINNLMLLFSLEKHAVYLLIFGLGLWLINIRKTKGPINLFIIWMILGILVFSKFPLSHYHQFHYIGLLFIFSSLISKSNIYFYLISLIIASNVARNVIFNYWQINITETHKYITLDAFVKKNNPKIATIWEWGRSSNYALLHTRDWICEPYNSYLSLEKPMLYNLTTDMNDVIVSCGVKQELFSLCWDQLYIQESEMPRFLEKYKDRVFQKYKIEDSKNMWLIKSDHCTNK